ncbi:MAG TPA: hemolysin III family protein [Chloroflexi bacterium]|nr:hemolysin III family protein [Chloroflexota bacterium]
MFPRYTLLEEILNASTHGLGVVLGAIGLALLVVKTLQTDSKVILVSVVIYGISIILLFAASTFYHAIPHNGAKRVLRIIDHCAIYLLIAGTYTPYTLLVIGDRLGAVIMAIVWSLAVAGMIFKIFFVGRFQMISLLTYLGMGWLGLLAAFEIAHNLPPTGIALLLGGGIAYSVGTIFFKVKAIPFNHAIWHLFVLAGCILHFLSVYYFVIPLGD